MKRKILALTLSIVLSASMLAGCGAKTPSGPINSGSGNDKEQTTDAQDGSEGEENIADAEGIDADGESQTEGESDGSDNPDDVEVQPNIDEREQKRVLLADPYVGSAYLVDGKGNKVEEFDLQPVFDYSEHYSQVRALEYFEGYLIVRTEGSVEGRWVTSLLAYNTENGKIQLLSTTDTNEFISFVDDYDGELYVGYYDYRGPDDTIRMRERTYIIDGDRLVEAAPETDAQKLLLKNEGYYFETNKDNTGEYGISECFTRQLRENGYLLTEKDKNLIKIEADGKKTSLNIVPDYYKSIYGFDSKYILLNYFDDENEHHFTVYDLENENCTEVPELSDATIIDYADGELYYYIDQSEEYGIQNTHIYRYDVASNSSALIYETRNVPGVSYVPGVRGFTLIDGEIYFVDVMDRMLKWVRVNYDESGASYTDIYCPVSDIPSLKYGNIDYISKTTNCPYCGIALEKEYKEFFRLLPEYSSEYEKINSDIEERITGALSEDETEYTDEYCEDHLEYPSMYCTSVDETVTKVDVLSDKYLTVEYSGYLYAGGAHGMPYDEQFVYSLETGERVELKDFYQGTEEEFVDLVLSIVKRDYENGEEYIEYMYNPDDIDAILSDVKNCTSFYTTVFFEEDGVYVKYSPYSLGPFASGTIDVFITYQELLGRDGL